MTEITVQLGDFTFEGFEAPDEIPTGGGQKLSAKDFIGGGRVVDAMGARPRNIRWSGRFRGPQAVERANYLDSLREAGKPLLLTWSVYSYYVLIEDFEARGGVYEKPYTIDMMVVADLTTRTTALSDVGLQEQVGTDMVSATGLAAQIGDSKLSSLMSVAKSAVSKVTNLATAGASALNTVLKPIAAVQSQLASLAGLSESALGVASTLGHIIPGLPAASLVANLTDQITAATRAPLIYDMQGVLGRVTKNLQAVQVAGSEQTVVGGDLFDVALKAYGDASEWATIAQANGLVDPVLDGLQTIRVPPLATGSGGVPVV